MGRNTTTALLVGHLPCRPTTVGGINASHTGDHTSAKPQRATRPGRAETIVSDAPHPRDAHRPDRDQAGRLARVHRSRQAPRAPRLGDPRAEAARPRASSSRSPSRSTRGGRAGRGVVADHARALHIPENASGRPATCPACSPPPCCCWPSPAPGRSACGSQTSRRPDDFVSLVIGVGVVVVLWALLIASTPQVVSLRGSVLTIHNSAAPRRFDLADGLQPVDIIGDPRSSEVGRAPAPLRQHLSGAPPPRRRRGRASTRSCATTGSSSDAALLRPARPGSTADAGVPPAPRDRRTARSARPRRRPG